MFNKNVFVINPADICYQNLDDTGNQKEERTYHK